MAFDFRRFDVYRKVPKDLTQPTTAGAIISIIGTLFIFFLFVSELASFMSVEVANELYVDDPESGDTIPVFLEIFLPNLACEYVGVDIQDEMGRHDVGFIENTDKVPANGGMGCLFTTSFQLNKVPGNFHVSTHSAASQPSNPDMTHEIRTLRFGEEIISPNAKSRAFTALNGKNNLNRNAYASHDYVMKIVPTVYEALDGHIQYAYQYTSAYKEYMAYGHGHRMMPAIWFKYELMPITVNYKEKRQPFYHFITMVCAIIGGTFTVAGIVDSFIFSATEMYKKFSLGKLS